MTHSFTPRPISPKRETLDQIIDRQYRYAEVDAVDADAHLRMAHDVEALRDRLFPPRGRTERRTLEAL